MTGNVRLTVTIIARRHGQKAGRVRITQTRHGYMYLSRLHVKRFHRGNGIARALMAEALRAYGQQRIELIVTARKGTDYDRLAAWYRAMGFVQGPSAWATRPARASDTRRHYRDPDIIRAPGDGTQSEYVDTGQRGADSRAFRDYLHQGETGCVCRLGPDCPRPGRCDASAIAASEEAT